MRISKWIRIAAALLSLCLLSGCYSVFNAGMAYEAGDGYNNLDDIMNNPDKNNSAYGEAYDTENQPTYKITTEPIYENGGTDAFYIDENNCKKSAIKDFQLIDVEFARVGGANRTIYFYLGDHKTKKNTLYYCVASYDFVDKRYSVILQGTCSDEDECDFACDKISAGNYMIVFNGKIYRVTTTEITKERVIPGRGGLPDRKVQYTYDSINKTEYDISFFQKQLNRTLEYDNNSIVDISYINDELVVFGVLESEEKDDGSLMERYHIYALRFGEELFGDDYSQDFENIEYLKQMKNVYSTEYGNLFATFGYNNVLYVSGKKNNKNDTVYTLSTWSADSGKTGYSAQITCPKDTEILGYKWERSDAFDGAVVLRKYPVDDDFKYELVFYQHEKVYNEKGEHVNINLVENKVFPVGSNCLNLASMDSMPSVFTEDYSGEENYYCASVDKGIVYVYGGGEVSNVRATSSYFGFGGTDYYFAFVGFNNEGVSDKETMKKYVKNKLVEETVTNYKTGEVVTYYYDSKGKIERTEESTTEPRSRAYGLADLPYAKIYKW